MLQPDSQSPALDKKTQSRNATLSKKDISGLKISDNRINAKTRLVIAVGNSSLRSFVLSSTDLERYAISECIQNTYELIDLLRNESVDILIMDKELGGRNIGMLICQQIKKNFNDVSVLYLVDPENNGGSERLAQARPEGVLIQPFTSFAYQYQLDLVADERKMRHFNHSYLIAGAGKRKVKIASDKIKYIRSEANYLHIHTISDIIVVRDKLNNVANSLTGKRYFLRAHQRFLVNTQFVEMGLSAKLTIDEVQIPVSKRYKRTVINYLNS